jgi:hypothetical protein
MVGQTAGRLGAPVEVADGPKTFSGTQSGALGQLATQAK